MAYVKPKDHAELKPEGLKWTCSPDIFNGDSGQSFSGEEAVVGQKRALKALKTGVDIKGPGYNIFITGLSGTGKFYTVKKVLEAISPDCSELNDYAYVHNFNTPDHPMLLTFSKGKGSEFRDDMQNAIRFLMDNIPHVLESESFLSRKKKTLNFYTQKQQKMMKEFEEKLNKDGLTLGQVKMGEMTRPEIMVQLDDEAVFVNQLDEYVEKGKLTEEQASEYSRKYAAYQEELQILFKNSMKLSQEFRKRIADMEKETVEGVVEVTIDELKEKFKDDKVNKYLDMASNNLLQNLEIFKGQVAAQEKTQDGRQIDRLKLFQVNVVLDNSDTKECPVYIETSPTFNNLFGTIEKSSGGIAGGWTSDFTMIKAGSLLRANKGYIIINAMDAFTEPGVWKTLKRAMLYGKLEIQDVSPVFPISATNLKPEPIDIETKVIFIGNNNIYNILSANEDDFNKIFKIKAEFDYEMNRTDKAVKQYGQVIRNLVQNEKLKEFDNSALAQIAEYGARYAGQKNRLTTRFAYISDLARESSFFADDVGDKKVSGVHVKQAYESAKERHSLHDTKLKEMINEDVLIIDTEGEKTGVINGLAVFSVGYYSFGKPSRITASVSLGTGNILNVDREAGLSGSSHNKGVLIITGYFREKFGRNIPLSFNASIVFEQAYGMIDGDSASVAEICALLSAISGCPIKQNLAVTGSVNQKGDVQPIGGVNEKIEGFFDVCSDRGLTGDQGVLIPIQNVKDLMLKDEVIEAVKNNQFHIYPIITVEDAVEILTGIGAGDELKSGGHRANSVFGKVEQVLKEMRKKVKPQNKSNEAVKTKGKTKRKK